MNANGLVPITPTSISYDGTSSINSDGSISLSSAGGILDVDGVFLADYDNYLLSFSGRYFSAGYTYFRPRNNGVNDTTATSYARFRVYGTTKTSARSSQAAPPILYCSTAATVGFQGYIFGPSTSNRTSMRFVGTTGYAQNSVEIHEYALHHPVYSSFDGFRLTGNFNSGVLTVFGFNQ